MAEASPYARAIRAKLDPLGWGPATVTVLGRAATKPAELGVATARLALGAAQVPFAAAARFADLPVPAPIEPDPKDRRFADPAWEQNPYFFALRQLYDLTARYVDEVLELGHAGDVDDLKAALVASLAVEAIAPTNFAATNPTAMTRAFQTGGKSTLRGVRLALDDLRERGGLPAKVDPDAFTVGENLAATPGAVVFRNDLIELIQYAPQTKQVHAVPVLASPPWINKYYVMDLAPGRSLVEWAIQHGRTVFMISYRNPDESMRDVTMDDYLQQGVLTALDVVQEITKSNTIDLLALCLGGAMGTMAAAYLSATGDDRLGSLTLLNTLLDYSAPGELGGFVDPETLDRIDLLMGETGYLEADSMALAFDLLRARDLIFRYIPERWLLGEEAEPFDLLAWNGDSTRMPSAMHSTYLRELYGHNLLARGELELAGQTLDPRTITADTYVVGAINDHIVPWASSYAATQLISGDVRYVLSSGGHIAGVVNPPSPKGWHEVVEVDQSPADPQEWRAVAERQTGSWWEDWIAWSTPRAGELVQAPTRVGSRKHPPLADAPGGYVLE